MYEMKSLSKMKDLTAHAPERACFSSAVPRHVQFWARAWWMRAPAQMRRATPRRPVRKLGIGIRIHLTPDWP